MLCDRSNEARSPPHEEAVLAFGAGRCHTHSHAYEVVQFQRSDCLAGCASDASPGQPAGRRARGRACSSVEREREPGDGRAYNDPPGVGDRERKAYRNEDDATPWLRRLSTTLGARVDVTTDPPPGLIPVPMKGAALLLTAAEFTAGVRRGK